MFSFYSHHLKIIKVKLCLFCHFLGCPYNTECSFAGWKPLRYHLIVHTITKKDHFSKNNVISMLVGPRPEISTAVLFYNTKVLAKIGKDKVQVYYTIYFSYFSMKTKLLHMQHALTSCITRYPHDQ